jgi:cell division septation protein DedD
LLQGRDNNFDDELEKIKAQSSQNKMELQNKMMPLKKNFTAIEETLVDYDERYNKTLKSNVALEKSLPKATSKPATSTTSKTAAASSTTSKTATSTTAKAGTTAASTSKTATTPATATAASTTASTSASTTSATGNEAREFYTETDKIAKLFIPGEKIKIQKVQQQEMLESKQA